MARHKEPQVAVQLLASIPHGLYPPRNVGQSFPAGPRPEILAAQSKVAHDLRMGSGNRLPAVPLFGA